MDAIVQVTGQRSISGLFVGLLCALLAACGPSAPPVEVISPGTEAGPLEPTATELAPAAGSNAADAGSAGYVNITPAELASMLEEKDFLLINTHGPYGYEIESTDAHIPIDPAGRWLQRYPEDRSTKIVLYCRSARTSAVAARALVTAGYTNLWHAAGFALVGN